MVKIENNDSVDQAYLNGGLVVTSLFGETIKIKYFDKEIDKIEKISNGDWIDLRSAETIHLKKGEFHLIPLGVGMKLPEGYEAHVVPRSSTYKNFGVLQTNHMGVIDNSYSGDTDQWMMPVIAMRDTIINKNDRICQFRITSIQPKIRFDEVEHLDEISRGGRWKYRSAVIWNYKSKKLQNKIY